MVVYPVLLLSGVADGVTLSLTLIARVLLISTFVTLKEECSTEKQRNQVATSIASWPSKSCAVILAEEFCQVPVGMMTLSVKTCKRKWTTVRMIMKTIRVNVHT